MKNKINFIKKTLKDKGIEENGIRWNIIYENAKEASDILTIKELEKLIEEHDSYISLNIE